MTNKKESGGKMRKQSTSPKREEVERLIQNFQKLAQNNQKGKSLKSMKK